MEGQDREAQCEFSYKYTENCAKFTEVQNFLVQLGQTNNIYSNADRSTEWKSVRGLKCTLQKVVAGDALDDALVNSCNAAAETSYTSEVGDVVADTAQLGAIVQSSYTCTETEMEFSGSIWDIPTGGDKAKSTDYSKKAYKAVVQRSADSSLADPVFDFCA